MKIDQKTASPALRTRAREDLSSLLRSRVDAPPPCAANCPEAFGPRCSRSCPEVPRKLSSDPEGHPLDPLIAPLVYEVQRLKVFQPCWSCEGHNGPGGSLWKVPRVWFYSDSMTHVRALAGAIRQMELDRRLHANWQVVLVSLDQKDPDCCFSLEPAGLAPTVRLEDLQADVTVIAASLHDLVVQIADDLARRIG